jgi:hypothetical protein
VASAAYVGKFNSFNAVTAICRVYKTLHSRSVSVLIVIARLAVVVTTAVLVVVVAAVLVLLLQSVGTDE